jgi:hypothetical protein
MNPPDRLPRHARTFLTSLKTAPLEWFLALVLPLLLFGALSLGPAASGSVWAPVCSVIFALPGVFLCSALHVAGKIGRAGRAVGSIFAVSASVAGGGLIASSMPPGPAFVGLLAAASAVMLCVPVARASAQSTEHADSAVWHGAMKLGVRLVLGLGFATWLSLLAAFVATAFPGKVSGIAEIVAFVVTFLCTSVLAFVGVTAHWLSGRDDIDWRLTGPELLVSKCVFVLTSLATIVGCILLYATRAAASGSAVMPEDLTLQTSLLVALAFVGPVALFSGAPFVAGDTEVRSGRLSALGKLMRLFPPAFVALFAWSGPAVMTAWSQQTWRVEEKMGAVVLAVATGYCVLRTAFDLLDRRLPIWVMPAFYLVGALGFAMVGLDIL